MLDVSKGWNSLRIVGDPQEYLGGLKKLVINIFADSLLFQYYVNGSNYLIIQLTQ